MNFSLTINISKCSKSFTKWKGRGYYNDIHYDNIEITNGKIKIIGSRNKLSNLSSLLFNTNTTLYRQIVKTLSFYYLCTGEPLRIETVVLNSNTNEEEETEFLQPFDKSIDSNILLLSNELTKIFSNTINIDKFLNGIIYYIKALQDGEFDNYWKAFNSLYSLISSRDNENEKLRDMRTFIEANKHCFSKTLTFLNNDSENDIRLLRIREFILNNWPNQNSTKAYVDMIKRFSDVRIIKVLEETLPYRIEFIKNEGLENDIRSHIALKKSMNKNDNVELLCFYILKYAYFVRNKYFHAEKASPNFILKDSAELQELSKIVKIFQYFLSDLIRCNNKYL